MDSNLQQQQHQSSLNMSFKNNSSSSQTLAQNNALTVQSKNVRQQKTSSLGINNPSVALQISHPLSQTPGTANNAVWEIPPHSPHDTLVLQGEHLQNSTELDASNLEELSGLGLMDSELAALNALNPSQLLIVKKLVGNLRAEVNLRDETIAQNKIIFEQELTEANSRYILKTFQPSVIFWDTVATELKKKLDEEVREAKKRYKLANIKLARRFEAFKEKSVEENNQFYKELEEKHTSELERLKTELRMEAIYAIELEKLNLKQSLKDDKNSKREIYFEISGLRKRHVLLIKSLKYLDAAHKKKFRRQNERFTKQLLASRKKFMKALQEAKGVATRREEPGPSEARKQQQNGSDGKLIGIKNVEPLSLNSILPSKDIKTEDLGDESEQLLMNIKTEPE